MPQKRARLTAAFVKNAPPGIHLDSALRLGLQLRVGPNGSGRWIQRIVIQGKRVDLGLGPARFVSLTEARETAFQNAKIARTGGDPREAAKLAQGFTFSEATESYLEAKLSEFRNAKHRQQWRSTLDTYAAPLLGGMAVDRIKVQDVVAVLEPIWATKTETASRLRGRVENVLAWATVNGYREGDNPARWRGNLDAILPKPGRVATKDNQPALSLSDIAPWFADLRTREGFGARALEFAALTAARSGEVRGATWAEFNPDLSLWIIPATRMKMDREHRVPLSPAAVALLKAMPRIDGTEFVFPAMRGGQLSDMTLSATMRRMHESKAALDLKAGIPEDKAGWRDSRNGRPAVPHGLRSTFRDWAAEAGKDRDMAELALAHSVGSAVERAYRRGDMIERRRDLMAQWAAFLGAHKPADDLAKLLG